jgi:ribosomal protein S18|uniref:Small ribosomal subunit protein bS18c n=1 Tax=Spermatozopsis similis TaxID=3192 RepID=A0A499SDV3_SPESI|nr:ribosomal protein S18 [Spermatozopsis similis]AYQ95142.1 ribosomal protein S18 [Spermatozopsis similis]
MAKLNTTKKTNSRNSKINSRRTSRRVLSVTQLLARLRRQKKRKGDQKQLKKPIKPIIPPKSLVVLLKDKPEKAIYNRRIIDYKHCGLLQRYIGLGGKILPRRQTRLTAKQQRYVAKTIKSARIMGLLPFVSKEKGFFR